MNTLEQRRAEFALKTKYLREGRCDCNTCGKEVDLVMPVEIRLRIPGPYESGYSEVPMARTLVAARHLRAIEGYNAKGAFPTGFCEGSLATPKPPPARVQHNHITRDIKKPGKCPACDEYLARRSERRAKR